MNMAFALAALGWGSLFVAISTAKPTDSNSKQLLHNTKDTAFVAANKKHDKYSIMVNGDYYAGPNKEIETLLRGIQGQLSTIQQQLQEIKPVDENETGEGQKISKLQKVFIVEFLPIQLMNRDVPTINILIKVMY